MSEGMTPKYTCPKHGEIPRSACFAASLETPHGGLLCCAYCADMVPKVEQRDLPAPMIIPTNVLRYRTRGRVA